MTATFTYDAATGTVAGPLGWQRGEQQVEDGSWVLCQHLRFALEALLGAGAHMAYVTGSGSWSLIDLDVQVDHLPANVLPAERALPRGLTYWTNTDTHYPLLSGLSCKACRQTLSWPPAEGAT